MVRGIQKQIIHLKNTESPYFEEAFLIVRQLPPPPAARTMVEEANRLLFSQTGELSPGSRPHRRFYVLGFLAGALVGAAVTALVCLL